MIECEPPRSSEEVFSKSDDGLVGGPRTPQQMAAQKRLQQTQAQVDEVVDIMKTNVEKVLERDQKLSELDDRAGKYLRWDLLGFLIRVLQTRCNGTLRSLRDRRGN